MSLAPGTRLDRYEILGLLGSGGMGEVYRAHDPRAGRDVAIKTSRAEFSERFEREARAVAKLNHQNVCTLYDVGKNYLVMELIEGETLRGPLTLDETLKVARQMAAALEAAHEKGIVHRDLKPANVKITPDGVVKVLDFGLARMVAPEPEVTNDSPTIQNVPMGSPTMIGTILGTAAYMAPEQARGKVADKRADIWAFGVVLYEVVTGKRLFEGETVSDVLAGVLKSEPDLSAVPVKLRRVIAKCLEKDPKKRLRDIGDWEQLLVEESAPAPAERQARWLWPAAVGGAVLLAGVAGWMLLKQANRSAAQVLKYSITAPEANSVVQGLALSPDGSALALTEGSGGIYHLWVRRMDDLEWRQMPGTDGATYPFWSPDGSYIAFFAESNLKKIAAAGGPPQTICATGSTSSRGGSWGEDGTIVFALAGSPNNELQRVPASGGTPTALKLTEGFHKHPFLLPGGRRVVYWLGDGGRGNAGIWVSTLDGKQNQHILNDNSAAFYGAGRILFVRENTLMVVPFDEASGKPTGEPAPVAEGVSLTSDGQYLPVQASANGLLVYQAGGQRPGTRQLAWVDRSGKTLETLETQGDEPVLSPDGKSIAFVQQRGPNWEVWVRDLVRGTEMRLTSSGGTKHGPLWSPAGDSIIFERTDLNGGRAVYRKMTGGQGQEELVYNGPFNGAWQWTSDNRLLFSKRGPDGQMDVSVLPLKGPPGQLKPETVVPEPGAQGQISSDGHWIAYASDSTRKTEIYVRPMSSGPGVWRISTAGGEHPLWRGDGKELFYIAGDGKMTSVSIRATSGAKPVLEAGAPTPLFDTRLRQGFYLEYAVTPDGKKFLLNRMVAESSTPQLVVTQNWHAGLKK